MNILVIDDSEDAREIMEVALASAGYPDVSFAASGYEALRFLGIKPELPYSIAVEVILLDVLMPGMDGVETCAHIRADSRYGDVPIIMVTGQKETETLVQAFMAGANDYVTKPFDRIELLARIRSAYRLKGELDRRRKRDETPRYSPAGSGKLPALDPVTGLLSQAVLDSVLSAWSIAPADHPIAAFCVQMTDYAKIFKQLGDAETCVRLRSIASTMASLKARVDSLLALYQDGLFVLIIPKMPRAEAGSFAETIARTVNAAAFHGHASKPTDSLATVVFSVSEAGEIHDPRAVLLDAIRAVEGNSVSRNEFNLKNAGVHHS